MKHNIKDALAYEENFFRNHAVYHGLHHCCGIPQLAKKLNQILMQHIKTVLPGLKSRIDAKLISVTSEFHAYGGVAESKDRQEDKLLNFITKYCQAFTSMVDGINKGTSTSELSCGARIRYIFQSIFVKHLEAVNPCDAITDQGLRTAIQNANGLKCALFVPEVPFEILVRRQIGYLLNPSLQCAKMVFNELIKTSHCCLDNELQQYPFLRRSMAGVVNKFLYEGLEAAETMITQMIQMEMDYINISHPNFIGGSNAMNVALQQDGLKVDTIQASERSLYSGAVFGRSSAYGIVVGSVPFLLDTRPVADSDKPAPHVRSNWQISSIFGSSESCTNANLRSMSKFRSGPEEGFMNNSHGAPVKGADRSSSMIHLIEPSPILKPSANHTDKDAVEIATIKLLLKSYYGIVRKNIEDLVPKAIMHFLVNHMKRELHNVLIKELYREDQFEHLLREPDEVVAKRKRIRDTYQVLQQASLTLDLLLEAKTIEEGYNLDSTYLSNIPGSSNDLSRHMFLRKS